MSNSTSRYTTLNTDFCNEFHFHFLIKFSSHFDARSKSLDNFLSIKNSNGADQLDPSNCKSSSRKMNYLSESTCSPFIFITNPTMHKNMLMSETLISWILENAKFVCALLKLKALKV